MEAKEIVGVLAKLGNQEKAAHLSQFFKTGRGEYGEGDLFLGVTVPEQRAVAKQYEQADWETLEALVASPWHEVRLTGLLIVVRRFGRSAKDGVWLEDKDRELLYRLADSEVLWEQRIAMVTCMHFVRKGDFKDCLAIADKLLEHPHDLIQKAVGWLLREVGKKDKKVLVDFLAERHKRMPRTMLRYAIERFPEAERKAYLGERRRINRGKGLEIAQ